MFISSVLAGLVLAVVRRGDLRALATLRFRWWWLIPLGFALKLVSYRAADLSPWLLEYGGALHVAAYVLLLGSLALNFALPGMPLISAGIALNALVILANGGRMPASEATLASVGKAGIIQALYRGAIGTHTLMGRDTRLPFLGDWIALPPPWSNAVSPGDFVLAAGIIWLITRVARPPQSFPATPAATGSAEAPGPQ